MIPRFEKYFIKNISIIKIMKSLSTFCQLLQIHIHIFQIDIFNPFMPDSHL